MRKQIFFLLIFSAFLLFAPVAAEAQSPCPNIGPCDMPIPTNSPTPGPTPPPPNETSTGFNEGLQKFYRAAATVIPAVFANAERYLNEYFLLIIGILVGIVVLFSMLHQGFKNLENPSHNFASWAVGVFLFAGLLTVAGDIDGDGRSSDIVEWTRYAGYYIAYGSSGPTATTSQETSNPLPILVNQQVDYYNVAYKKFVDGAFTVQVDPNTLPVTVPRPPGSAEQKMRVLFLETYSLKDAQGNIDFSKKSSEDWISWLFQLTNLSRTLFELSELFVLLLQALSASLLRLTFPFLLVFCIDPTLRKQILGTWIDQLITFCFVLPIVAQVARFITYMFCNLALYAQSDQAYYTYDPTTASVIQQHSLVMVAGLFAFMSFIMAIILGVGTPAAALALRRFQILPFLSQSIGATFSMMLSTGLSYTTGLLTGSMQEKLAAQRAFTQKQIEDSSAINTYLSNSDRNQQAFRAASMMNNAETNVGKWNLDTNRTSSMAQNQFEQQYAFVQAGMQFDASSSRAATELFKSLSTSDMDKVAKDMGITTKELSSMLKHTPEVRDITAKQVDETFILGQLGGGNLLRTADNMRQLQSWINDPASVDKLATDLKLNDTQKQLFGSTIEEMRGGKYPNEKINTLDLPENAKQSLRNVNAVQSNGDLTNNRLAKMNNAFVQNGKLDSDKLLNSFSQSVGQLPGGEKMLMKAGFKPEQIQALMSGQAQNGAVISPTGAGIVKSGMKIPKSKQWIPAVINDEAMRLGWTPQARLAWLGNVGRENSFNSDTIFKGHLDPASFKNGRGAIYNAGIISWNGTRGKALKQELAAQGLLTPSGQIVQNEQSLRTMMRFADKEMQTGRWGNQANVMRNPNLNTQQISKSLQRYILYDNNPANGYNSLDSNFDVKSNAEWAGKVAGLVYATSNRQIPMPTATTPRPVTVPRMITMGSGNVLANSRGTVDFSPLAVTNPTITTKQTYQTMQTDVDQMGITMQKTFAPIYAESLELQSERGVAEFIRQSQQNISQQVYVQEQNLNQRQFDTSIGLATDKRNFSDFMANFNYERGASALDYMHGVKMDVAKDQLETYQNVAGRDYMVSSAQNSLRYEHALYEAREQMMINLISSVTQNLDRQTADMFEKINSRV